MQNRSVLFVMVFWGTLLLISSYAVGQDQVAEAKSEFERGVAQYNLGLYDDAAKSFRKTNEIKPTWSRLFNIAQSEAAAKRYDLAYEAFEEYLAKGQDAVDNKRRELVIDELDKMQKLIGSLEVETPQTIFIVPIIGGSAVALSIFGRF